MNTNIYILCINQNNYILEHNMIKYIIIILILICYSFIIYFKITHRFWSRQPVFHFHNLLYWLKPPGIISTSLPSFTSKFYSEQVLLYNYMNLSKKQKGVLINKVEKAAPCFIAGVKRGDIIIRFDEVNISNYKELQKKIANSVLGQEVFLTILRDGSLKKIQVKIEKLDPEYFVSSIKDGSSFLL